MKLYKEIYKMLSHYILWMRFPYTKFAFYFDLSFPFFMTKIESTKKVPERSWYTWLQVGIVLALSGCSKLSRNCRLVEYGLVGSKPRTKATKLASCSILDKKQNFSTSDHIETSKRHDHGYSWSNFWMRCIFV